jgi:hypothetical protein
MADTYSIITLYDKTGKLLAEVPGSVAVRAWSLNENNQAQFVIPTSSALCREDYLRFGNYVMITHPKLPVWAGMIDPTRGWELDHVEITAFTPEYILKGRRGAGEATYTGSPGSIFTTLIGSANSRYPTLINLGEIFKAGASASRKLNFSTIYDGVIQLSQNTGEDFDVTPVESNGILSFVANWYKRKGDTKNLMLEEGVNVERASKVVIEQGDIINVLQGMSDGGSSGSKMTVELQDAASIALYGVRQSSYSFQGIKDRAALTTNTQAMLLQKRNPRKTFVLAALDVGTTFNDIRLGDIFPVSMKYIGFKTGGLGMETLIRVEGMAYDDNEGKLKLVCNEMIITSSGTTEIVQ